MILYIKNENSMKGVIPMKKVICKREYDTETASLLKKHSVGKFGDPAGYEESLYQMPSGFYFLYVNGGADSIHPTEDIKSVSRAKAEVWLEEHP